MRNDEKGRTRHRTRVLEVTQPDGRSRFYAQREGFFGWHNYRETDTYLTTNAAWRHSLADARQFLAERVFVDPCEIIHPPYAPPDPPPPPPPKKP